MPILDLQKRARELGRIRLGQKTANGAPQKLDRFRFTSASQALLEKVAELYGGDVQPWTPPGGTPQWEVISASARLPIMVPPQPVTQWHEAWRKSGCVHRCNGYTNVLLDEPCDPDDPLHQEALRKPTTRLNVVLRDVTGIGVWRVESHGWNAAIEIPDVAEFLARAGGYVEGWLALEQRTSVDNSGGKPVTRHFAVPIIEIDVTPAELMAGHGRVAAPALTAPVAAPVAEPPALPAVSVPDYAALADATADIDALRGVWSQAQNAGHLTPDLSERLQRRAGVLQRAAEASAVGAGGGAAPPVPAVTVPAAEPDTALPNTDDTAAVAVAVEPDPDAVWLQIVATAGQLGWTTNQLTADFRNRMNLLPDEATGGELADYLELIAAEVPQGADT